MKSSRRGEQMTYNLEREIKIDVDETRREGYEQYLEVNVHEEIKQHMMTLKCFLNNLSQKLTVLKRCAERIKQPLWFKVKVTIRGHRSYI